MATAPRALVVSPTPAIGQRVVEWLSARGHQVVLLTDFGEARRALDARLPDLLVTELKLGAFNGLHLTLRARARSPEVAVIVIGETALADEARRQDARYVTQPLDEIAFAHAVREVCAHDALVPVRGVSRVH
jgi:DNA-binding response OmpR family regulator